MSYQGDDALTSLGWFTFMQNLFENERSCRLLVDSATRFAKRMPWIVMMVIGWCLTDGVLLSVSGQSTGHVGTDRGKQSERWWVEKEAAFYVEHCFSCHQGETAEAGLDLSSLGGDLSDSENMRRWVLVHDRI